MIELPEAKVLSLQINKTISGKIIKNTIAAQNPHKFAWYSGDPASYEGMLNGKTIGAAIPRSGMVEIAVEDVTLLFTDGVNLRFHSKAEDIPSKHQLLIGFTDGSAFSATVAMYGGLWCFKNGINDNPYYLAAVEKPSPLTDGFNSSYFEGLFTPETEKFSLKAFLATGQRIPGLGNGVLQDILYIAHLHPKRKISSIAAKEQGALFQSIKDTLHVMVENGGRDIENDLFGNAGGYITRMSRNTVGHPCQVCSCMIVKQPYMGGSIYFCPGCQKEG
jgi:formamidopyrimidine-DNA glycosylase